MQIWQTQLNLRNALNKILKVLSNTFKSIKLSTSCAVFHFHFHLIKILDRFMNFNFLHSLHSTPFAGSTVRAAYFWVGVFYRPLPSKFPTCQRKLPPGNYCVCATGQEEKRIWKTCGTVWPVQLRLGAQSAGIKYSALIKESTSLHIRAFIWITHLISR